MECASNILESNTQVGNDFFFLIVLNWQGEGHAGNSMVFWEFLVGIGEIKDSFILSYILMVDREHVNFMKPALVVILKNAQY